MPVLFIGHGNPMNVLLDNSFTRDWERVGASLPRPKAVLSISAHWLTPGATKVHVAENPRIIYDFYGFPDEMYSQEYDAPGSPEYAKATSAAVTKAEIAADAGWGLDHGTWTVMKRLFPDADVPVYQMSLDYSKEPSYHYELAADLSSLRRQGVLIIGSGNVTHNLRSAFGSGKSADWAIEFDTRVKSGLDEGKSGYIVDFLSWGNVSKQAHPTHDHFLPLISCLGLREEGDTVRYFAEGFDMGTISMRSFILE